MCLRSNDTGYSPFRDQSWREVSATLDFKNFLKGDFDEEEYPSDVFYTLDDLFVMHVEVQKFINTIKSVSARLHQ